MNYARGEGDLEKPRAVCARRGDDREGFVPDQRQGQH